MEASLSSLEQWFHNSSSRQKSEQTIARKAIAVISCNFIHLQADTGPPMTGGQRLLAPAVHCSQKDCRGDLPS